MPAPRKRHLAWYNATPSLRRAFDEWSRACKVTHAEIRGERELELIRRAKAGDRGAREVLDAAHLPLVYLNVRRYFGHGVEEEDLLQEGRLGLQHAVDKFDESKGVPFANYAAIWIRSRAAIYLSECCGDVRVAPKVRGAFSRKIREGTPVDDLAASPRLDDRTLHRNIVAVLPTVSLDEPVPHWTRDGQETTVGERVPSGAEPPDEALDGARLARSRAVRLRELVDALPPAEREVVARRYPLDPDAEPEMQVTIAADWRGRAVTRQRIQQVEVAGLERLRVRLEAEDPDAELLG